MIRQLVNNPDIGWNHPDTIYLATEILSDFGAILEACNWMIFGRPDSLLSSSKKDILLSFEVLLKFLGNNDEWKNFRDKNPKTAKSVISDKFYRGLIGGLHQIETFLPEEDSAICEDLAASIKTHDTNRLREILSDEKNMLKFIGIQSMVGHNTETLYINFALNGLLSKEDFDD